MRTRRTHSGPWLAVRLVTATLALFAVACSDDPGAGPTSTDSAASATSVVPNPGTQGATSGSTTTSVSVLPATGGTPKPLAVRRSPDCVFSKADQPVNVAFCDAFDEPNPNPATRAGDLDATVWGVSRINTVDIHNNTWMPAELVGCGPEPITVQPPNDVRICDGRLVEAVADGGGQPTLAMYPKQPFDIAGRTGTVVFDVSANSEGPHAAWPEFWWTNLPVPAPRGHLPSNTPYAENSFGFTIDSDTCGPDGTNVHKMFITRNYLLEDVPFSKTDCVTRGSATGGLNHFEVRMSETHVEVWASDAGSTSVRQIAVADLEMPMTRGVIWIEDVHYNANKFDTQGNHTFAWDNVGFDGPTPYRDLTFDIQDQSPSELGYQIGPDVAAGVVPGVYWLQSPTKAFIGLNWFAFKYDVPSVRLNGGEWHETKWPFDSEGYTWRTIAIPIPLDEVKPGDNAFEIKSADVGVVSNINLILIAASPVP
jgi:hypothetical protein